MVYHNKHTKMLPILTSLIAGSVVVMSSILSPLIARADQYDDQINAISAQKAQSQQSANVLGEQAQGVQGQIDGLRNQIAAIQAQIDSNTARQNDLNQQIDAAQKKLTEQNGLLSANIRSMYIESDISPLEMIASSKNLGDFVDKQEYRDRIKDDITKSLDTIQKLKIQLDAQQAEVTRILADQTALRGSLNDKESQAAGQLSVLQQDKAAFDAQVQQQSAQISSLKAQQRAANQRALGGVTTPGDPAKGGYPAKWANAAQDSVADNWGMYNRECVSYAAWRVYASGRNMPYWGGRGNANQWPSNARSAGISVDGNPQVGDVAISTAGYYGHAMYVEEVSGGKIYVSQYNYNLQGEYSEMWISSSGLQFLHF